MKCNADRLIEALIATEMMEMQRREADKKEKLPRFWFNGEISCAIAC
jgi:hypothetical protein